MSAKHILNHGNRNLTPEYALPAGMRKSNDSLSASVSIIDQGVRLEQEENQTDFQRKRKSWKEGHLAEEQKARIKHWKQPKVAMLNKEVQVYDHDVLKQKYNWKTESTNKMIQTDDIILEQLAKE
jgi:hypothetical protein